MIEFRSVAADHSPARELVRAMELEMSRLYDGLALNAPDMPKAGATEFAEPRGTFLVGFRGDEPIACGGLKDLGVDQAAEIKRMYVVPAARGGSVGRELLAALENAARARGYRVVRLDTGPRQQGVARMYRNAGYRDIENFNSHPMATYFGEKVLS